MALDLAQLKLYTNTGGGTGNDNRQDARLQMILDTVNHDLDRRYGPEPTSDLPNMRYYWRRDDARPLWFKSQVERVISYETFDTTRDPDQYYVDEWYVEDRFPRLHAFGGPRFWQRLWYNAQALVVPKPQPWRNLLIAQLVDLELSFTGTAGQSGRGNSVRQYANHENQRRKLLQSRLPVITGNMPYHWELTADDA